MMENNSNGGTGAVQFDEAVCERYIFGELSESEQEEFETAYFNDDAFFERFIAVKNELLDLYSRGELEADKRDRLEPHFLATPSRTRRLAESSEFIRAVTTISDRDRVRGAHVVQSTPGWFDSITRFLTLPRLAGAVALIAFSGGALLVIDRLWQRGGNVEQAVQQASANMTEVAAAPNKTPSESNSNELITVPKKPELTENPPASDENTHRRTIDRGPETAAIDRRKRSVLEPTRKKSMRPDIVPDSDIGSDRHITIARVARDEAEPAITLRPGSTRDIGAANTLTVPPEKDGLPAGIALIFKRDSYQKYIVTITTVDGKKVSKTYVDEGDVMLMLVVDGSGKRVDDGSNYLVINIDDTSRLAAKDYIVTLEGQTAGGRVETIEEYYFHVRRAKEEPTKKP